MSNKVIVNSGQDAFGQLLFNKTMLPDGSFNQDLLRQYAKKDTNGLYCNFRGKEIKVPDRIANASTLRKDEWLQYDTGLIEEAQIRLTGVQSIIGRGLIYNFPNGFGKTILESENVTDMNDAEVNMDGVTRGENARIEFNVVGLPLPITHKSFQINARALAASRQTGQPLDTTQGRMATRKVAEKMEEVFVNGLSTYTFGSYSIYGLTDFPSRTTGSLGGKWTAYVNNPNSIGSIGEQILNDVLNMEKAAFAKNQYGPYVLYIPKGYEYIMDKDYAVGYPKTIRNRLLELNKLDDIIVLDKIAADNVVLCQMSIETVRMVNVMPITNVQWGSEGNQVFTYKVMSIQVPEFRTDAEGNSGVTHYIGT